MSVLAWIILGLIAGFIASNILKRSGQGLLARHSARHCWRGGFSAVGATGITGFNLHSIFVAILGAIAVLSDRRSMSFGKA